MIFFDFAIARTEKNVKTICYEKLKNSCHTLTHTIILTRHFQAVYPHSRLRPSHCPKAPDLAQNSITKYQPKEILTTGPNEKV